MIPARLVTTWITGHGDDPYDDAHRTMFAQCLQSWLRVMPDYEIVILTRASLPTLPEPVATWDREGYYVDVSNWLRLAYLHTHGGCYVDMDVEAVQRLDALRARGGCQVGHFGGGQDWVNTAVVLAEAGHPALAAWLGRFQGLEPDGNRTGPKLVSTWLRQHGWDGRDEGAEVAGVTIHPHAVFYPYHWSETAPPAVLPSETVVVHHWARSWFARAGLPA